MSWSNRPSTSLRRRRAIPSSILLTIASISAACWSRIIPTPPTVSAHGHEASSAAIRPIHGALLADLNSGVRAWVSYQSRETEGTQSPIETLDRGWGSCRDLAVLLIEAARSLGFGARVVTGYLHNASADGFATSAIGAGTTHAWADIYLPGAGWIAYDPTNGTIGSRDLIRVAVTRDISQAVPIAGSFVGMPDDYLGLTVDVAVIPESPGHASTGERA